MILIKNPIILALLCSIVLNIILVGVLFQKAPKARPNAEITYNRTLSYIKDTQTTYKQAANAGGKEKTKILVDGYQYFNNTLRELENGKEEYFPELRLFLEKLQVRYAYTAFTASLDNEDQAIAAVNTILEALNELLNKLPPKYDKKEVNKVIKRL